MIKKTRTQKARLIVQLVFLFLVVYVTIGHYLAENYGIEIPLTASIHKVCPFGGVVTLYHYFTTGDFVKKLYQSNFVMINDSGARWEDGKKDLQKEV